MNADDLLLGVLIGMTGMLILELVAEHFRNLSLVLSAKAGTAVKIRGRFYHIVPEEVATKPKTIRSITISGYQLRTAADFVAPHGCEADELESEAVICWRPAFNDRSGEGESTPAGLCIYLAEYPEEGSMFLYEAPRAPEPPVLAVVPGIEVTEVEAR